MKQHLGLAFHSWLLHVNIIVFHHCRVRNRYLSLPKKTNIKLMFIIELNSSAFSEGLLVVKIEIKETVEKFIVLTITFS